MQTNIIRFLSGTFLALALMAVQPALVAAQVPQQEVSQGSASLNWSGYVAQTGTYTSVSGSWIVPIVSTATSSVADATWVGIGGVKSNDLIQAGTQAIVQNATVTYNAWVETLPGFAQTVPMSVQAGDLISASVSQQSSGVWLVTIHDNTTGQEYQTTLNYDSSLSSAEWIEEMISNGNGTFRPLDSFGSVSFTGGSAAVDGENETISQSGAQALQMINTQGETLAEASALGADGASFTVDRTSASASVAPRNADGRWHVIQTATSTGATPQSITVYRRGGGQSRFGHYQLQFGLPAGFTVRFIQIRY